MKGEVPPAMYNEAPSKEGDVLMKCVLVDDGRLSSTGGDESLWFYSGSTTF